MKLHELYEAREFGLPPTLSQEELDALKAPSANNVEDRFKVGKVAFDNVNGLGNTPNGQNIIYLGWAVMMRPSQFLELATKADRSDDAKKFVGFIKQRVTFASPQLYVKVNEKEWGQGEDLVVKVTSHEGRGRCVAFEQFNDDSPIPVQFIPGNGMRARDLSDKFFTDLRHFGIVPQEGTYASRVDLGKIFWMGKTL